MVISLHYADNDFIIIFTLLTPVLRVAHYTPDYVSVASSVDRLFPPNRQILYKTINTNVAYGRWFNEPACKHSACEIVS